MIIKSSPAFEQYKNTVSSLKNSNNHAARAQGDGRVATEGAANTDKVSFSSGAAQMAGVGRLVTSLSTEVSNMGNTQRLQELGEQVRRGTYYVGTGALADAILGHAE